MKSTTMIVSLTDYVRATRTRSNQNVRTRLEISHQALIDSTVLCHRAFHPQDYHHLYRIPRTAYRKMIWRRTYVRCSRQLASLPTVTWEMILDHEKRSRRNISRTLTGWCADTFRNEWGFIDQPSLWSQSQEIVLNGYRNRREAHHLKQTVTRFFSVFRIESIAAFWSEFVPRCCSLSWTLDSESLLSSFSSWITSRLGLLKPSDGDESSP
jgi:hypothetical protein